MMVAVARITLRTPRLELRPVEAADRAAIEELAHGPGIDWAKGDRWAIVVDGRVAGSVFLVVGDDGATGRITCLVAPPWWRQGIATEASEAVIGHAFTDLGLRELYATADPANRASVATMRRVGMRFDGLQDGEVTYRLAREDWSPEG
jgi:RimJ/RimL family protein N-acetyltransferase